MFNLIVTKEMPIKLSFLKTEVAKLFKALKSLLRHYQPQLKRE